MRARGWIYRFYFGSVALVLGVACLRVVVPYIFALIAVAAVLVVASLAAALVCLHTVVHPSWSKLRMAAVSLAVGAIALAAVPLAGSTMAWLVWGGEGDAIRAAALAGSGFAEPGGYVRGYCVTANDPPPQWAGRRWYQPDPSPDFTRQAAHAGLNVRAASWCRRVARGEWTELKGGGVMMPVDVGPPTWWGPGRASVDLTFGGEVRSAGEGDVCFMRRTAQGWRVVRCHGLWVS